MADDKKCFIIMPITTPKEMETVYSGGAKHFRHVLECLFKPSVSKAGYNPIPPTAEGSVNIQASIIRNLETADLVLCDMSCLNANVFFEWGIRTSLNRPVCIVKDELTKEIPFDPGTLNCHPYNSRLEGWEIEDERAKLVRHIQATVEKSGEANELWRYFGLKEAAEVFKPEKGENAQLGYLAMQMETLQKKFDSVIAVEKRSRTVDDLLREVTGVSVDDKETREGPDSERVVDFVRQLLREKGDLKVLRVDWAGSAGVRVALQGRPATRDRRILEASLREIVQKTFGVDVHCVYVE